MRWFKSLLRRRIEKRITELLAERCRVTSEKNSIMQSLNPAEYAKYWLKEKDLRHDINLLEEMLKR